MIEFFRLSKVCFIFLLISVISCTESSSSEDELQDEEVDSTAVSEDLVESEILFEGVFNSPGQLESRSEMIEVLGRIGVHDYLGTSFSFLHVEKIEDGYQQTCDIDFKGTIDFRVSGEDKPQEFYNSIEPVFEHNVDDQFPYWIEDVFVNPKEKELMLKARFLEFSGDVYGPDMAKDYLNLSIKEDPNFGPIMEFQGVYYMREDFYQSIPSKDCPTNEI